MTAYIPHICAFILICLIAGGIWAAHRLIESALPPSAEEIERRITTKAVVRANKEFKQRQRLRVVRFWNIFN
jgi:hypothetical protein